MGSAIVKNQRNYSVALSHAKAQLFYHTSKIVAVIQAFSLDSYGKGSFLMLLKHLGFADLPITRGGKFFMK